MRAQVMQMARRAAMMAAAAGMILSLAAPMNVKAAGTAAATTQVAAIDGNAAATAAQAATIDGSAAATTAAATAATQDLSAQVLAIQAAIPEGTPWTNETNSYTNAQSFHLIGRGCMAFAMQMSDLIYGTNTAVTLIQQPQAAAIQVGDIVRISGIHSVFVIAADAENITVAEGNYNSSVHYGRVISRASLEGQVTCIWRR